MSPSLELFSAKFLMILHEECFGFWLRYTLIRLRWSPDATRAWTPSSGRGCFAEKSGGMDRYLAVSTGIDRYFSDTQPVSELMSKHTSLAAQQADAWAAIDPPHFSYVKELRSRHKARRAYARGHKHV